jgi:hypothetical protein
LSDDLLDPLARHADRPRDCGEALTVGARDHDRLTQIFAGTLKRFLRAPYLRRRTANSSERSRSHLVLIGREGNSPYPRKG